MVELSNVESIITDAIVRICPAVQMEVRLHGEVILSRAYGWLDPETHLSPTQPTTRFDLASVTKLFVVTTFMTLVEAGQVKIDQPVHRVLPEFAGVRPLQPYENPLEPGGLVNVVDESGVVDASQVTFRHLLTHTSGLPAWRP